MLIYESMYKSSCTRSLELFYNCKSIVSRQDQNILDQFTDLFGDMHNLNGTATELHLVNITTAVVPWALLHTKRICLHCLRRKPEYVLTCGHTICDACIRAFGNPLTYTEYQYQIDRCLLCRSGTLNIILQPPTAGFRLLSIDGGGFRGVVPLECLRLLQQSIGSACRVQDLFDLAVGTSSGLLASWIRGWDEANIL